MTWSKAKNKDRRWNNYHVESLWWFNKMDTGTFKYYISALGGPWLPSSCCLGWVGVQKENADAIVNTCTSVKFICYNKKANNIIQTSIIQGVPQNSLYFCFCNFSSPMATRVINVDIFFSPAHSMLKNVFELIITLLLWE